MSNVIDRAFTLIRQLQGALDGKTIRAGSDTLTFAASTNSGTITVTHGLGATPGQVVATAKNAPAFGNIPVCHTANYTDTTFQMNGETKSAFTGSVAVSWVAIA
jgi:hypothetical protein